MLNVERIVEELWEIKVEAYENIRPSILKDIFRTRKRVFHDRLKWEVDISEGLEYDRYDTDGTTYIYMNYEEEVVGGVRMISTANPYMAKDTFGGFDVDLPSSASVIEASRFHMAIKYDCAGCLPVGVLLYHMVRYAISVGAEWVITVVNAGMLRVLRKYQCPFLTLSSYRYQSQMTLYLIKISACTSCLSKIKTTTS